MKRTVSSPPWQVVITPPPGSLDRLLQKRHQRHAAQRWRPVMLRAMPAITALLVMSILSLRTTSEHHRSRASTRVESSTHAVLRLPSSEPDVELLLLIPHPQEPALPHDEP